MVFGLTAGCVGCLGSGEWGRVRGGGLGGFLEWLCCFSIGCVEGLS